MTLIPIPKYWENPLKSNFSIIVTSIEGTTLFLKEKVPFFRAGGGQPSDKAYIEIDNIKIDIKSFTDTTINVKLPKNFSLKTPLTVKAGIDIDFRKSVMRAHTCQHLLSAILAKDYNIDTKKAIMQDDQGQLFSSKPIPIDFISSLVESIQSFIINPIEVKSHILKGGNNKDQNGEIIDLSEIRGTIPENTVYTRIVSMGNAKVDLNTCGGTHLSTTSEILAFTIVALKKDEIQFLCGFKALKLQANINQDLIELSKTIKRPFIESVSMAGKTLIQLRVENEFQYKRLSALLKTLFAEIKIDIENRTLNFAESTNNKQIQWMIWTKNDNYFLLMNCKLDRKLITDSLQIFKSIKLKFYALILDRNDNLLINVNNSNNSSINAKDLASKFQNKFSIKGGGSPELSQVVLNGIKDPFQSIILFLEEINLK